MLPQGALYQQFWNRQSFRMCDQNEMIHFKASLG